MITLRKRGNIWHARGTMFVNGKLHSVPEFSTRYSDFAEAERFLKDWELEKHEGHLRRAKAEKDAQSTFRETGVSQILPSWARQIWKDAKRRSASSGIVFDLGEPEMAALVNRAGGKCEVSRIEFADGKVSQSYHRPFIPSLDRIDSSKGYTLENTRIVCCAVNVGINQWGEDVFLRVCRNVARINKGRHVMAPRKLAQIVPVRVRR